MKKSVNEKNMNKNESFPRTVTKEHVSHIDETELKRWLDNFEGGTKENKEMWLEKFVNSKKIMDRADEVYGKTVVPIDGIPDSYPEPAVPAPMKTPRFLDNPMEIL